MAHGFPSSGFPCLFLHFSFYWALFPHIMNVAARVCRSPDSWPWTDHSQISLIHSPPPPKCSTRPIMALINNLGIVYHQYCSSSGGLWNLSPINVVLWLCMINGIS
jgi:hypothetical protein